MIHLARAALSDVEGIGAVVRAVWEQHILPDVCRAQIEAPQAALWVAREEADVVGFASAFATSDRRGRRRWEIDLVAVRPSHQGRGLGRELIQRVSPEGVERGSVVSRALIGVDNVPSQWAFQRAGFARERRVRQLLVWSPRRAAAPPCPSPVSLVPVDTLTYRGLWIEGLEDVGLSDRRAAITAARSIIADQGRLNTGAVLPADAIHLLAPTLRAEAEVRGKYCWFSRRQTPPAPQNHCHGPGQVASSSPSETPET